MLTKLDLSQCEKEAIHIPNLVQPHGFALVIEKSSLNVTRSSANFDSTSIGPASQLVGRSLQSILPPAALAAISQKLDFSQRKRHVLYGLAIPSISVSSLNVAVCDAHREIILEFLPGEADGGEEFVELQLNDMIPRVMMAQSSEDFFQRAAIELRSLTGYDRVMVYRFDEDFNGQVIAESHEQGMESYLGLHYPASDIPVQARELYRKNMIRTIVDVSYEPVGIVSRDPAPLDMSYSYLRSVSPIHLEYLKNMGVAATLTVSIIVDNALWGLVSCHHRTPYLPHMKRVGLAEVFGNIFGGMIQMREESERDRVSGRMLSRLDTVMDIVMSQDKNQDVMDLIDQRSFLFQSIFPSDGFLVRTDSQIVRRQFDLDDKLLTGLLDRLAPLMRGSIFYTDHLAAVLPDLPAKTLRECAGVMALQLDTRPPSLWLWRRSEKTQTITWGGDPNQKVILNQQGVISPRKSFEKYNQIVTGQSTRWNSAERDLPRYLTAQIYRLFEFFESSHQLENQKKQIQFMEEEKAKHYQELIEMLVGVIEQRDAYTAGHTRRVADYCVAIAQKMGLDEASVSTLREAAILHDIGKVIIPDSILLKPGRLSFKEYELIKAHLSVGY
ncbi:MAG TPA: GAF domain-containing protein, partial [Leptospiraceae bacterium]|nr:GAF domain-containing protein [Leptospiraceae bacterium]